MIARQQGLQGALPSGTREGRHGTRVKTDGESCQWRTLSRGAASHPVFSGCLDRHQPLSRGQADTSRQEVPAPSVLYSAGTPDSVAGVDKKLYTAPQRLSHSGS